MILFDWINVFVVVVILWSCRLCKQLPRVSQVYCLPEKRVACVAWRFGWIERNRVHVGISPSGSSRASQLVLAARNALTADTLKSAHSFFNWPSDPSSQEPGWWETKHFIGIALDYLSHFLQPDLVRPILFLYIFLQTLKEEFIWANNFQASDFWGVL